MVRVVLRWLLPLLAVGGLAAGVAHAQTNASSSAVTWPASCELKTSSLGRAQCFDKHLNALDTRLRAVSAHELADRTRIAALRQRNTNLAACLGEFPVTKRTTYDNWYSAYNDGNTTNNPYPQYFNQESYYSQPIPDILEQTQPSWTIDYWFVRDSCTNGMFTRPPAP